MAGEASEAAMIAGPVAAGDWLVIAPVAIAIAVGALLLMIRHAMRWHGLVALAGLAAMFAANLALLARVLADGPVSMTMGRWLPPFGISFTADALGALFSLTASFVAFVCAVYSLIDIDAGGRRYGFYTFLMLMMAGVSGAFLTGDIFNLYVWFEVFLISSFGLLILGSRKAQIDGAVKYAILNLVATTLFLITTGLLYGAFGTLNMADIARKADGLRATAPLVTLAVLYLLAFGMKAAAFPVNFWLPASYHTPRIVTAALFGGLLTKIGIYALLRVLILLFPAERGLLSPLIGAIAIATILLGALGALAQSDIRRMMGFLVISGVGVMLAGLASGGRDAIAGTVVYALHSMLAMTALYLLAGVMQRLGASTSLHRLCGLYGRSPLLAGLALFLVLAVSGLPPGSGLWPKVMLVRAALDAGWWGLAAAILVSSLVTIIALGRFFILAFWREPEGDAPEPAGTSSTGPGTAALAMLVIPAALLGLYPEPFIAAATIAADGLLAPAAYIEAVFPEARLP